MRIGLMAGATDVVGSGFQAIVDHAKMAEQRGFDTVWLANIFGLDAVSLCAQAG